MKAAEPFIITMIQDLSKVSRLVNGAFNDEKKTTSWLNSGQSFLEGKEPTELIFSGRTEELITLILEQIEKNEL